MLQLFQKAKIHSHHTAIKTGGRQYSFQQLLFSSQQLASVLLDGKNDLAETRVAYMVNPGFDYVATQWAIWQAGGVAVPLCITYPLPSLQYVLEDTGAGIVVVSPGYKDLLEEYATAKGLRLLVVGPEMTNKPAELPKIDRQRRAMILYTSGTTNLPKGVVTTHANLEAQVSTLVEAWQWSKADHTVCVLPLHHVHGIINVVSCSLWAGATCEFLPEFSPQGLFELFNQGRVDVFMAVPTIYFKLIAHFESLAPEEQKKLTASLRKFRLMVSGSAALPVSVMEKWEVISGHRLLERYGMTELGMAISNPYLGERKAGFIGQPLPGVSVRLMDDGNQEITEEAKDGLGAGEIQVKGQNVFLEYWGKPEATAASFTADGWFKTGDISVLEDGYYRILGRSSVDIIKSGGYKISALEIEEILRSHEAVKDCAVVGLPNDEWGELIAASVITNGTLEVQKLSDWMRSKLPGYKVPRKYLLVDDLPRNAMGKVTKNEVKKLFNQ